jgi:hypothetical protein
LDVAPVEEEEEGEVVPEDAEDVKREELLMRP